ICPLLAALTGDPTDEATSIPSGCAGPYGDVSSPCAGHIQPPSAAGGTKSELGWPPSEAGGIQSEPGRTGGGATGTTFLPPGTRIRELGWTLLGSPARPFARNSTMSRQSASYME